MFKSHCGTAGGGTAWTCFNIRFRTARANIPLVLAPVEGLVGPFWESVLYNFSLFLFAPYSCFNVIHLRRYFSVWFF